MLYTRNRHDDTELKKPEDALEKLRKAYNDGKLTLYIGAGVSVESGLPRGKTWCWRCTSLH